MKQITLILLTLTFLLPGDTCFSQQSRLHIYGFFDFEAEVSDKDAAGERWAFDQHHLNVLATYHVDSRFRVATEIEWEHGPAISSEETTGDFYLAKAFLEYRHSDAIQVRLGKFLSPFGIYNERHDATPTFLFTFLPQAVYGKTELSFKGRGRLFAKHGTGLQLLGSVRPNDWGIEYRVYLTNGRGPNASEKDDNANKGVGGRLVVSPPVGDLRLGASYYDDKNGEANNSRQTTIGFDMEFDHSDAHFEAEYIIPRLEMMDGTGIPTGRFRNVNGFYVLGAYTLFDRFTPFARYEFFDPNSDVGSDGERIMVVGINHALSPSVYLKAEAHMHRFQDASAKKHELYVASVAVAF